MKRFLVLLVAALVAGAATARADAYETVALPPVDDVSLPFLCAWGYDWEERCYRDRLERLELGGPATRSGAPPCASPSTGCRRPRRS